MSTSSASPPATPSGVLRTRLLPPRLPPHCLGRAELVARAGAGLDGRMLVIVAGAGYGKSTLLAQCMQESELPWVWLSCNPRVATPEMLATHIAAGLTDRFPGVASGLGASAADYIELLANEIVATIPDDFALAFDDVHALNEATLDGLGALIADLPPNVHLVLASRRNLPSGFGRVPAGDLTRIAEQQLTLSYDEAVQLLADRDDGLDEVQIGEVHEKTEGWVSGLLLATRPEAGNLLEPGEAPHFDYLAEEVFESLPKDQRRFLTDTATLELAASVTGRSDARELIHALRADHLFIVRLEGQWFRYHHLFEAFLRRRVEEREPERLSAVHARAGQAWQQAGEYQEAVRHYLGVNLFEEAAKALDPMAEAMVATPEAETLAGWLARIPENVRSRYPRLLMAHALLAYLQRQRDDAFRLWPAAIEALIAADAHDAAVAALYRFQQRMLTYGVNPQVRIAAGERYLAELDRGARGLGMVHLILGVAHAQACRPAEAERHIAAALELSEHDSWDAADFLALADRGNDDDGLERLLRAESLWTSDFLPDFPYDEWAQRARSHLERQRAALLERLGDALLANGRPVAAIARYRELLANEPEREALHRALMRSYAAAGERALSLRQFHACRTTLRGSLGVEPSRRASSAARSYRRHAGPEPPTGGSPGRERPRV